MSKYKTLPKAILVTFHFWISQISNKKMCIFWNLWYFLFYYWCSTIVRDRGNGIYRSFRSHNAKREMHSNFVLIWLDLKIGTGLYTLDCQNRPRCTSFIYSHVISWGILYSSYNFFKWADNMADFMTYYKSTEVTKL